MRCETGRCLGALAVPSRQAERRVDPLWHVLLHEKSEIGSVNIRGGVRSRLLCLAETLRGTWFWYYTGRRDRPSPEMMDWAKSTTYSLEWLLSPRAFRAPSYWPDDVDDAFGPDVPTPWELSNAFPHCLPKAKGAPDWYGHDVSCLVSYACGLSVYEMSKIIDINERAVLSHMVSGVHKLRGIPQYKLWAMNLEWSSLMPLTMREASMDSRVKFFRQLSENPMGVGKRDVEKAYESITFKFSVESSLCPKRSVRRPVHEHVMVCEPR